MSIPLQSVRNWPLSLYALSVLSISACAFGFPTLGDSGSVASGLIFSGYCMTMLLAGLGGRTWFEGVLAVVLLGCIASLASDIRDFSRFVNPGAFECFMGSGFRIPYIPAVVLVGSSPLLFSRYFLGWRLTRNSRNFAVTRAKYGVEQMLLFTAITAAALFLLRIPDAVYEWENEEFLGLDRLFRAIAWVLGIFSALWLPIVFWVFRSEHPYRRYKWMLAAIPIAVFSCTYGLYDSRSLSGPTEPIAPSFVAAFFVTTGLAALHSSGFRLAQQLKSVRGNSDTFVDPELKVKSAERELRNQRLNRTLATSFVSVSIAVSAACSALQSWRRRIDIDQQRLTFEIAERGGMTEFQFRKAYRLKVDKQAGDDFLTTYGNFSTVVDLSLEGTQISDVAIANLSQFKNLHRLNLNGTKVSDTCVDDLCKLPELYELKIAGTAITRKGRMQLLKALTNLSTLDASDLGINDDELNELSYSRLYSLEVRNNPITDEGLNRMIAASGSYRFCLDLSGTLISGASLPTLENCPLVKLGGAQVTDQSILQLLSKPFECMTLKLRDTSNTDAVLPKLLDSPSVVWILEIGDCDITEIGFAQVASQRDLSNRVFGLTGKQFTGNCFQDWHPSIHSLNMQGSGVTDESLKSITNLELLSGLSVGGTNITDKGIKHLKRFKQLYWLDVSNTHVTAEGLIEGQIDCDYLNVASGQFTAVELKALSSRYQLEIDTPFPYY